MFFTCFLSLTPSLHHASTVTACVLVPTRATPGPAVQPWHADNFGSAPPLLLGAVCAGFYFCAANVLPVSGFRTSTRTHTRAFCMSPCLCLCLCLCIYGTYTVDQQTHAHACFLQHAGSRHTVRMHTHTAHTHTHTHTHTHSTHTQHTQTEHTHTHTNLGEPAGHAPLLAASFTSPFSMATSIRAIFAGVSFR